MTDGQIPQEEARVAAADLPPLGRLLKQYLLALFVLPVLTVGLFVVLVLLTAVEVGYPPVLPPLSGESLAALSPALLPVLILAYYGLPGKHMRTHLNTGISLAPLGSAVAVLFVLCASPFVTAAVYALTAGAMVGGLFALATLWAYTRDAFLGCWSILGGGVLLIAMPLGLSSASWRNRFLVVGGGLLVYLALVVLVRLRSADVNLRSPYAESFRETADDRDEEEHAAGMEP